MDLEQLELFVAHGRFLRLTEVSAADLRFRRDNHTARHAHTPLSAETRKGSIELVTVRHERISMPQARRAPSDKRTHTPQTVPHTHSNTTAVRKHTTSLPYHPLTCPQVISAISMPHSLHALASPPNARLAINAPTTRHTILPTRQRPRNTRPSRQNIGTSWSGQHADPVRSQGYVQSESFGEEEETWVFEQDSDEEGEEVVDEEVEEGEVEFESLKEWNMVHLLGAREAGCLRCRADGSMDCGLCMKPTDSVWLVVRQYVHIL